MSKAVNFRPESVASVQAALKASGGIGRGTRLLDLIIAEEPVRFAELEALAGLHRHHEDRQQHGQCRDERGLQAVW